MLDNFLNWPDIFVYLFLRLNWDSLAIQVLKHFSSFSSYRNLWLTQQLYIFKPKTSRLWIYNRSNLNSFNECPNICWILVNIWINNFYLNLDISCWEFRVETGKGKRSCFRVIKKSYLSQRPSNKNHTEGNRGSAPAKNSTEYLKRCRNGWQSKHPHHPIFPISASE